MGTIWGTALLILFFALSIARSYAGCAGHDLSLAPKQELQIPLSINAGQTLGNTVARKGTESGGGGGVVWITPTVPVLMDFFTLVSSPADLPLLDAGCPSQISEVSKTPIRITEETEASVRASNPAFGLALDLLAPWSKLNFDTISYLVLSAFRSPLSWNFTDEELQAPPFYRSTNLPVGKTQVAAYYSKGDRSFQVSLSRPVWNQLPLLDQAGLLIHEALRQVQLGYGNGFNDESLQRSTAIYLLCTPTARLNYYLFYILNNSPEGADKIYGPFPEFVQHECRRAR